MQVVKHCTELETDIEDFLKRKMPSLYFLQVVFQVFAFNELQHQITMLAISKVVINAREVGMPQAGQQMNFAVE